MVLAQREQWQESLATLNEAMRLEPGESEPYFLAAGALLHLAAAEPDSANGAALLEEARVALAGYLAREPQAPDADAVRRVSEHLPERMEQLRAEAQARQRLRLAEAERQRRRDEEQRAAQFETEQGVRRTRRQVGLGLGIVGTALGLIAAGLYAWSAVTVDGLRQGHVGSGADAERQAGTVRTLRTGSLVVVIPAGALLATFLLMSLSSLDVSPPGAPVAAPASGGAAGASW